ncbi:MAG: TIGR03085 family metal-binding protein [Ilumatobacteraceae bacterium]
MGSSYPAQHERAALCDLFVEVGPDAPTLCGEWTTRDLAAHLVMRERRPDGAIGILVPKASGYADKVQAGIADQDWSTLVDRVRGGPPIWSPTKLSAIDKLTNTVEFFVHHEDVRRAGGDWEARDLDDDLSEALYGVLSKMAKRLVKSSPVGIVLDPGDDADPVVAKDAEPSVAVQGDVGELVLFSYGRQAHSDVEFFGDADSIDAVRSASFGL